MDLQHCYSASEDTFSLPRHFKERYSPKAISMSRLLTAVEVWLDYLPPQWSS
jgi:hypothetical protein